MHLGGRRFLLSLAIIGAAVCLSLGISLPIIRLTKYVFWSTEHSLLTGIELCADPYSACAGAQVLAVLTEWDEFRWLDFGRVAEAMAPPRALVDARNLLDPAAMRRRGFAYQGVGR